MRIIPLFAALLLASCSKETEKTPAKDEQKQVPPTEGAGGAATTAAATGEYKSFDGSGKVYPLSKAFAAHIESLAKTKPTTPASGPRPSALPRGIITVNGKGYSYFGTLWQADKEYWDSPQLREFWKFLNSHPLEEIPEFEPSGAAKP